MLKKIVRSDLSRPKPGRPPSVVLRRRKRKPDIAAYKPHAAILPPAVAVEPPDPGDAFSSRPRHPLLTFARGIARIVSGALTSYANDAAAARILPFTLIVGRPSRKDDR